LKSGDLEDESLIRDLTMFIFDSSTGSKEFSIRLDVPYTGSSTEIDMTRWTSDQVIMILNSTILSNLNKTRNIHIVSNIAETKLSAITDEDALKAVITEAINSDIAYPDADHPLLMHGSVQNHNFSTELRANISLVRNLAKVKMTINTQDFTFGGTAIQLAPGTETLGLKLVNGADRSYVVTRSISPSAVTYYNGSYTQVAPGTRGTNTTQTLTRSYIHENLRASYNKEENVTGFILQIPYQQSGGSIKTDNYYKVIVNQDNNYHINRNTIYDITLNISSLGGETESSAPEIQGTLNILPWNENTLISDISQTWLTVKETITRIGSTKNFYCATNADIATECTLEPGASWLTASFTGTDNIELIASGDGYTGPRSTTLNIKANNLTKVITVTQAPVPVVTNAIKLSPPILYLSEIAPTKSVSLTVNPAASPWRQIEGNTSVATCSQQSGTGNMSISFTQGTVYENSYFKFANLNAMEYDSVKVCNLKLEVPSVIEIGGQAGTTTNDEVVAKGGDADWVITNVSGAWMVVTKEDGKLKIVAEAGPDEQKRYGSITVAHINDASYTKVIPVTQMDHIIVEIEDFNFLAFRYWFTSGRDLDTAFEFTGNGLPAIDDKPVGWHVGTTVYYGSDVLLYWAGDNTGTSGGEEAYADMKILENVPGIADKRYIYMKTYACWYNTKSTTPIDVQIYAYEGGAMVKSGTTFVNNTGILRHDHTYAGVRVITAKGGITNNDLGFTGSDAGQRFAKLYKTSYTPIGIVTYDRLKGKATFVPLTTRSLNITVEHVSEGSVSDNGPLRPEILDQKPKTEIVHYVTK